MGWGGASKKLLSFKVICLGEPVSVLLADVGFKSAAFREKGDKTRVLAMCLSPPKRTHRCIWAAKSRHGSHHVCVHTVGRKAHQL